MATATTATSTLSGDSRSGRDKSRALHGCTKQNDETGIHSKKEGDSVKQDHSPRVNKRMKEGRCVDRGDGINRQDEMIARARAVRGKCHPGYPCP